MESHESLPAGATNPRRKLFSALLRVALLAAAFLVLRRELSGLGLDDLIANVRSYGLRHLILGLAFTVASFLTLGFLELLALRYVGKRAERIIPQRTAFATAFVAHAYSQSVGLAILTGTAVRIRSYSRYGLNAPGSSPEYANTAGWRSCLPPGLMPINPLSARLRSPWALSASGISLTEPNAKQAMR